MGAEELDLSLDGIDVWKALLVNRSAKLGLGGGWLHSCPLESGGEGVPIFGAGGLDYLAIHQGAEELRNEDTGY